MIRDYPRMVSSLVMALLTNTDTLVALLMVAQIVAMNPKNICVLCSDILLYCYLQNYNQGGLQLIMW